VDNPFATRWVRPGAISYHFPVGQSADTLVDRLRAHAWWGEIVGPHGAGKSTLLATLLPALEAAGRKPILEALHDGQRRLPHRLTDSSAWTTATQIVIDGYEQLSYWSRLRLKRACRRVGCGLLVTSHRSVGLPELIRVEPNLETLQGVVAELLAASPQSITRDEVARSFAAHHGNARDTLFDLYDLYEQRRQV